MIVEGIRYNRLSYIGEFLHKTLSVFQDTKDFTRTFEFILHLFISRGYYPHSLRLFGQ